MSSPGRPKSEYRSAQHEGTPVSTIRPNHPATTTEPRDRRATLVGAVGGANHVSTKEQ